VHEPGRRMRTLTVGVAVFGLVLVHAASARADQPAAPSESEAASERTQAEVIEILGARTPEDASIAQRAVSLVGGRDLERMDPRTTAEALVLVPGLSVQKTNHAGGSPIIRGLTGQKVLLLIDGFRLSNAIMRAGPSQYLGTVDADSVAAIEVLRGSASVLYGSDAIGGVVHVHTRAAERGPQQVRLHGRGGTADRSAGGRADVAVASDTVAVRVGAGGSSFNDLRGAGPVAGANDVPIYDGAVQRFTGYDEAAADARATWTIDQHRQVTGAVFAYRQYHAPRTDTCSPASCLVFDEQFHDMAYLRYQGAHGPIGIVDTGVAVGRLHERRSQHEREADSITRELDEIWSVSARARASLRPWRIGPAALHVTTGLEGSSEHIDSTAVRASQGTRAPLSRGKFLDGSSYSTLAMFGFGELRLGEDIGATAGVRLSSTRSRVTADPSTGAAGFVAWQTLPVASAGVRARIAGPLSVTLGVDQGFRTPNLYDLTATTGDAGPGYQLPNPGLAAESSLSFEGGLRWQTERLQLAGYVHHTRIRDFITRAPSMCPPELADRCGDAGDVFRMVNADQAVIRGVETSARWQAAAGVVLEGSATWTHGDAITDAMSEPLPKVPPIHGAVVARREASRWFVEAALRWATAQRRLAPRDESDARIPMGGTPGYAVVDVRAGGQIDEHISASLALENLFDSPYRVHGSGVDGAGLGAVLSVTGTFR
jgi:outer membrane receptor protein involved in Fe transport